MRIREIIIVAAALALAIAAERLLLPDGAHGHSWWSRVPGFFALFGFVICLVLIFFGKMLAKLGLLRDEGYYDRND
jgi:hypothetical protein